MVKRANQSYTIKFRNNILNFASNASDYKSIASRLNSKDSIKALCTRSTRRNTLKADKTTFMTIGKLNLNYRT